ncbi:MAG: hypothetical protein IIW78_01985, partial [Clostridia bacterium]|nr:hypothetical protein [Clostridia bacterium]
HTRTVNTAEICRNADIIVTAAGVLNSLTKDFVREGQIVIGGVFPHQGRHCEDPLPYSADRASALQRLAPHEERAQIRTLRNELL